MFDLIRKLRPYFFSLREIDNNVSLDIRIPLTWKYEDIVKPYSKVKLKIQDKNDKVSLLSLVTQATEDGYSTVFACALEIIVINKEDEEKQKLYQKRLLELQELHQQKIKYLQDLFKKESLDNLKNIDLLGEHGQENVTSEGMVGQGNAEGPTGGDDPQETID